MNLKFSQDGNFYCTSGSNPVPPSYGQYGTNEPGGTETIEHEQINITRTIRTQGLRPVLPDSQQRQLPANQMKDWSIQHADANQLHFNQQPVYQPTPTNTTQNWVPFSANSYPPHHQTAKQTGPGAFTASSKPSMPIQMNQVYSPPSTEPFQNQSESSFPPPEKWNQKPFEAIRTGQRGERMNADPNLLWESPAATAFTHMNSPGATFISYQHTSTSAGHLFDPNVSLSRATGSYPLPSAQGKQLNHQPAFAHPSSGMDRSTFAMGYPHPLPELKTSDKFMHGANPLFPHKRPHSMDPHHHTNARLHRPTAPPPYKIACNSVQRMMSSHPPQRAFNKTNEASQRAPYNPTTHMVGGQTGAPSSWSNYSHNRHLAPQSIDSIRSSAQTASARFEQIPFTNNSKLEQTPTLKPFPSNYSTKASSSNNGQSGSSSLNASMDKTVSFDVAPLKQTVGISDTKMRKAGNENQGQTSTSEAPSSDQADFNWQAPEFDRQSKEILSLIRETQKILGIENLDLPWITSAHVFVIAADAIGGSILETTMHILRLGHLKSLPNEPDNPLENVDQEIAEVVNGWYEQSEEDMIESEYFELLKTINKYRQKENKLSFKTDAPYKSILKKAATILKSERTTKGTDHLPPKNERASLLEFLQSAIEGSARETFKEQGELKQQE
ncbi:hypothetical protein [Endozoicomonas elysicola]|nr:hypothetical protein [Endozoicomonas elysicola]